jgi:hypothetical protein
MANDPPIIKHTYYTLSQLRNDTTKSYMNKTAQNNDGQDVHRSESGEYEYE